MTSSILESQYFELGHPTSGELLRLLAGLVHLLQFKRVIRLIQVALNFANSPPFNTNCCECVGLPKMLDIRGSMLPRRFMHDWVVAVRVNCYNTCTNKFSDFGESVGSLGSFMNIFSFLVLRDCR